MNTYPNQEGNFADKENRQKQQDQQRPLRDRQITEEENKRQKNQSLT